MEKIKNVLHGHKKDEDVAHGSHPTSSTAEGERHPIYDEMKTGQTAGHNTTGGSPYADVKTTSGEPYTVLAHHGSSSHDQPQHVGTDGSIGHSGTATSHDASHQSTSQTHAKNGGEASIVPQKVQEKLPESVERAVPNAIHDTGDRRHDTTTSNPSTVGGENLRPDANPTGREHHGQEMSSASIKSGVIGFGPGERQGHAAISTHNPTGQYMERDQVVGGGTPGTAAMTGGQSAQSGTGAQPYSQSSSTGHDRTANLGSLPEDRPYDNTLRQESYTADTDRSFPLAGGVTSRPHDEHTTPTRHATEHTPATQTSAMPTSTLHQQTISEREPGTKEREAGVREGHGREGLAGAAAAATGIGASQAYSHGEHRDARDSERTSAVPTTGHTSTTSHSQPNESEGILAKGKRLIGLGSSKDESTHADHSAHHDTSRAHDSHPEALAAATAAASKASTQPSSTHGLGYGTQERGLPGTSTDVSGTGVAGGDRPQGHRMESHHRHIPGEFVTTPHEHKGTTYLDYHDVVQPPPGAQHNIDPTSTSGVPLTTSSNVAPTSTSGTSHATGASVESTSSAGPHELRHTGTLDEPRPRSSDEHHLGRDAAIAGGLGAGAAGLGAHAGSHHRETSDIGGSKPLYEESSPYSSKQIDPRVLGNNAPLQEQRFGSQAKSEVPPHHAAQTSNPTSISSASATGPSATHEPVSTGDSQHHYSRDAALVGAGTAATGGLYATQRNDTPGTGTAILPQGSSHNAPSSGYVPPQQSSNTSSPFATSASSAPQQSSGNNTFYGTSGAPAPVVDQGLQQQHPSGGLENSSTSGTSGLQEREAQHHYGRDAALGGAGLAAAGGGLHAANRDNKPEARTPSNTIAPGSNQGAGSTTEDPASRTIGPHKSNIANILDPRVKPDPSKQKEHNTTGPHQSDTLNRLDPKADEKAGQQGQHHYGKDAAVVGGSGAAGYGAYEAAKAYGDHPMTQPGAAMNEQRYDPTARTGHGPNPIAAKSEYNYNDPNVQSNVNRGVEPNNTSDSHRNAALGTGAGLAAAGLAGGAYAGSRHADDTQQLPLHQKQDFSSSTQPGYVSQSAYPTQGATQSAYPAHPQDRVGHQQPYDATRDPSDQSHDKRNAALLGGAGAAATGGAAYAYSQQDDRERARLEERQQELAKKEAHDREKQQHALEKEKEKEQHRLDKEQAKHDKEVHKHDKAVAAHEKEEHRLQKEHDKEVAAHEKEQHRLEKEELKRQQEAEKETEGEKKKGGLLGFLHRDKSKKEKSTSSPESSPRNSKDYSPRHSKEYAAGAGALGVGTTAAAYGDDHPDSPRYKAHNKLHKDPPVGHPAREALEHPYEGGLTGKREHVGVDGPIGDPHAISGDRETRHGVYGAHPTEDLARDSTVIEPHTGLPMNVGRYGEGTGGTDANPTIHGVHHHGATAGQTGTNLESIRKADTPY